MERLCMVSALGHWSSGSEAHLLKIGAVVYVLGELMFHLPCAGRSVGLG